MNFNQELEPFVGRFIEDLKKYEKEKVESLKSLEKQIAIVERESQELKIQKAENNRNLDLAKDVVSDERIRQVSLNNEIKDEIARYSDLSKEIEIRLKETEQNFKDSQVEKELVLDALTRAKKQEIQYKDKAEFLKTDFARLHTLQKELTEKEKLSASQKAALNKLQDENVVKGNQLNDIDLRLKAREKEVNRLIKRYELEKFIKKE